MTKVVQVVVGTRCVVSSIVVVGALTRYAILHSAYDLKAAQKNVKRSLIWQLTLYELELAHNAAEKKTKIFVTRKLKPQLITVH